MSEVAQEEKVPNALNIILVIAVASAQAALLWSASHVDGWLLVPIALAFSFLFLTNYALMHEASHGSLHEKPAINWALGAVTGLLFPTSATMMRLTHVVHHRCNRTDHEMFDCYYPGDNLWLKRAQWYSILTGGFYLIIPIGAFLIAFARPLLLTRPFKRSRSASVLYDDFGPKYIHLVRLECLALVAVYWPLLAYGILSPLPTLMLFLLGGLNWSTRQYVTHAWSRRDVIEGALNLKANPLMRAILLNGNWDLEHHRHPTLSWVALAKFGLTSQPPISFWRQYLSLWLGPRLAQEPSPAVLPNMEVSRAMIKK
jgi:fatty acid desaturase